MHNGRIGGYDKLRRRLEGMINDRYYQYRLGTTDTELLFYLLFTEGLEDDPVAALQRAVAQINAGRKSIGAEAPFRRRAAQSLLVTHERPSAGRFRTLDEEAERTWNEVPPNQLLVYERGGAIDIVPFIPD